jgi:preprotein translocase subunit SecG
MLIGLLTFLLVLTGLMLFVLIIGLQQGSEGGIGAAFGGGNSAGFFGASGGVSLIVKSTWICIAIFLGLAMTLAWMRTHEKFGVSRELNNSLLEESLNQSPAPATGLPATSGSESSTSQAPAAPEATPQAAPGGQAPAEVPGASTR